MKYISIELTLDHKANKYLVMLVPHQNTYIYPPYWLNSAHTCFTNTRGAYKSVDQYYHALLRAAEQIATRLDDRIATFRV